MRPKNLADGMTTFKFGKSTAIVVTISELSSQADEQEIKIIARQKSEKEWLSEKTISLLTALKKNVEEIIAKAQQVGDLKVAAHNELFRQLLDYYKKLNADIDCSIIEIQFYLTKANKSAISPTRSGTLKKPKNESIDRTSDVIEVATFDTLEKTLEFFMAIRDWSSVPLKWFPDTLRRYNDKGINNSATLTLAKFMCAALKARSFNGKVTLQEEGLQISGLKAEYAPEDAKHMQAFTNLLADLDKQIYDDHTKSMQAKLYEKNLQSVYDDLDRRTKVAQTKANEYKMIVASAKKIYMALYEGQTSFFKSNNVALFDTDNVNVPEQKHTYALSIPNEVRRAVTALDSAERERRRQKKAYDQIAEHAEKPGCRTATAWVLATRFFKQCSADNTELVAAIHKAAYDKSGFFKRTRAEEDMLSPLQIAKAPKGSRTAKIKLALG